MRVKLFFFTFLFYVSCFGQENKDEKRYPIDLHVKSNVVYSYRSYKEVSTLDKYLKRTWHNADIPKITYEAGLGCRLLFNKKIGLSTGLSYTDKGFKTKIFNVTEMRSTSSGNVIVSKDYQFEYSFKFCDIYVGLLSMFPVTPRSHFIIDIGLSPGIGTIYKDNLLANGSNINTPPERETIIGTTGTVGFLLTLTDHFSMSIHGTGRYSPFEFSDNFLLYGYGSGLSFAYMIK